ncbi:hypothetical protein CBR_g67630 [Chara braunii]|uniref:Uncharacterized protein n=1 Tax=Chara braunii TaxID=69332 RepID=A0A388MFR2_CHABU|nr:hypothetical protein CBR_g67630 [Chara braunii]|eukprot:GBG93384.1 hypothetical protein CBR_g67630 [Chara braunii]
MKNVLPWRGECCWEKVHVDKKPHFGASLASFACHFSMPLFMLLFHFPLLLASLASCLCIHLVCRSPEKIENRNRTTSTLVPLLNTVSLHPILWL